MARKPKYDKDKVKIRKDKHEKLNPGKEELGQYLWTETEVPVTEEG